ncbi:glutathione S-transferase [Pseudanabaena sp. FACHB-1998]|uniref:glutathione S-transferase n=1 Tax=Pseudanabaena sp. FACHB-1998 TaxID=2692858 RepID=UPI001680AD88|nr:glutathione S-transferase [Pseudanabaena sp. FACHB-1998]MBD2175643.1 glutathione S-transferase [Pseudanabaena sp. FACHB-1998]
MRFSILYSFRRCPYAIRARMALAYAGIAYELREITLKNKPKEMLEISPKGTTPVMQVFENFDQEGAAFKVLEESLDIMQWAIQHNDPENWKDLSATSLEVTQRLINSNDREFKQALDRYKYPNRYPERSQESYRPQAAEFLQVLESQLQGNNNFLPNFSNNFLVSDRQTLADVAIFPFVRQFAYVDINWFLASPYPHLQQWLKWHEESQLFELVMQKFPVWTPDQESPILLGHKHQIL